MLYDLRDGYFEDNSLESLLALGAFARLLVTEYTLRDIDIPPWLPKRQQEVNRAITARLEETSSGRVAEKKATRRSDLPGSNIQKIQAQT